MAQLCMYLAPFSPDYSGAGSILFDLNALTVMHDAGGCTGNYTGHDEPRWYGSSATVFCSALRMIDVIMGNDDKLKRNVIEAIETLNPEIIALVGSPVPMVIGMDLKGLATEIENETGIPAIGIETTGTDYYNIGVLKASKALFEKIDSFYGKSETCSVKSKRTFNILGATPLDYECTEDIRSLQSFMEKHGFTCTMRLGDDYSLDQLKEARYSDINLAISHSGYLVAKYMEKRYGIPYLCGFPFGDNTTDAFLNQVVQVLESKVSAFLWDAPHTNGSGSNISNSNILFIGDQVIGQSIKYAIGNSCQTTVGCIYGVDKDLPSDSSVYLSDEKAIQAEINNDKYDVIIADPMMKQLINNSSDRIFVPIPQYAISGDVYFDKREPLFGKCFSTRLSSF